MRYEYDVPIVGDILPTCDACHEMPSRFYGPIGERPTRVFLCPQCLERHCTMGFRRVITVEEYLHRRT